MKNRNLNNKIILERITSFLLIMLVFGGGMAFLILIIMQAMNYPIFSKNAENIFWQAMMGLLYLTAGLAAINISLNVKIVADYFASRAAAADNAYVKQSVGMIRTAFLSGCLILALFGYLVYNNYHRQGTKYIQGEMRQFINLFQEQLEAIARDIIANRNDNNIEEILREILSSSYQQYGNIQIIFSIEKNNELIFLRRSLSDVPMKIDALPISSELFYPASNAQRVYLNKTIQQNRRESKVFGRPPYNYSIYQPILLDGKVVYFLYINHAFRW